MPKKITEKDTKEVTKVIIKIKDRDTKDGTRHRTFTKEDHGENFRELADQFAETNKYLVIDKVFE